MTESAFLDELNVAWHRRCREFDLKPKQKKYYAQAEAFLEGGLQVAYILGAISQERMKMVYFMVSCGRIDMYLKPPTK